MYNGSYNTRGYRAKHTTIPKARRIKDRSFRAHPRLVVVPCVQLLYEAAPFLPSPSPDLFASARRSARLRFASFLRARKHSRHVFSSPSKSRNTSSAFRQLLQNRLGSAPRPVASNGGTVFARAAEDDGRRSRTARPRPRRWRRSTASSTSASPDDTIVGVPKCETTRTAVPPRRKTIFAVRSVRARRRRRRRRRAVRSGTRGGARDDVARSPFPTRGVRSRARRSARVSQRATVSAASTRAGASAATARATVKNNLRSPPEMKCWLTRRPRAFATEKINRTKMYPWITQIDLNVSQYDLIYIFYFETSHIYHHRNRHTRHH